MRRVFLWGLLAIALEGYGAPAAETAGQSIVLRNAGAEYDFRNGEFHSLTEARFHGKKFWLRNFSLSYQMPGDRWFGEKGGFYEEYRMEPCTHSIRKEGDAVTLEVAGKGKNVSLIRQFTMRGNSPALEVRIRMEFRCPNNIRWINLCGMPVPPDMTWLRLQTEVRNGGLVTKMREFHGNPFFDGDGRKIPMHWRQWGALSLIGAYDPRSDVGAILMNSPEEAPWGFRGCGDYSRERGYRCSIGISPNNFSSNPDGTTFIEAKFTVLPFDGPPSRLNETVIPGFVKRLAAVHLVNVKYKTGKLLVKNDGFALWSDLVQNRIFRDEAAPEEKADHISLFTAKDEAESFQLALKPARALRVSMRLTAPVDPDGRRLDMSWNAIGYIPANRTGAAVNDLTMIGDMPDILLPEKEIDCVPGKVQPFLVRVRTPADAKPGDYLGAVEVVSGKDVIAKVPVKVRVWNFSLANPALTAALDFWPPWKTHPRDAWKPMTGKLEKIVVENRGGARWVESPRPAWDADGNLRKVDYTEFDQSMEKAETLYKHRIFICRAFMLGYGHVPRKNLFGSETEILSPLWKKKILSFAGDFRRHLIEKKWNGRVVMDLFDEPYEKYIPMINGTVALLRTVAPEWRFTVAGAFMEDMNGSIGLWNMPMEYYVSQEVIRKIRAAGNEVSVYNPPGYACSNALTAVRGAYSWLWTHDIRYIYQWVVNDWNDWQGLNTDPEQHASWIMPGVVEPRSTLRMEATREGIEDYEYFNLLHSESRRLKTKAPELSARAEKLLKRAGELAWRTKNDERIVVVNSDPELFEKIHRECGTLLDEMSRH